ncbi:MAG: glycosyl transferase [Planctomycetes bacterium]|nr:glycosyl transferase [Planctomycetota bacterium]
MKPATSESVFTRRAAPTGEPEFELPPRMAALTNGRYTVRLNSVGGGYSECGNAAVTRCPGDPATDADGFHIYLRDADEDFVWSAGYQPTRIPASEYEFSCDSNVAEIFRVDRGIECRLTVCVSPQHDFEIRLCRLKNLDERRRCLEVTSYLEWVLGSREGDAGHPAFSKLFVETDYCPQRGAILARRRPRHCDEAPLWGFHTVAFDPTTSSRGAVSFETNRTRFIGRGRTLERPKALEPDERLTGDLGSVLDPIASLRIPIALEAGEIQEIAFVLGVASTKAEIDRSLGSVHDLDQVQELLTRARSLAPVVPAPTAATWPSNGSADGDRIRIHPPHRTPRPNSGDAAPENRFAPDTLDAANDDTPGARPGEPLQYDNGYGGFSNDGREYVIRVQPDGRGGQRRPPLPWVNVIANEKAGFLVTESGAGYTWCGNSRLNRLTAWHNDPVIDPHSEALWIRDEEARRFWSPLPGPTPAPNDYIVRHGFGYTTFEHESHGLFHETTMFVAPDAAVKVTRCRIANHSDRTRQLSLFYCLRWMLGGLASETSGQVTTNYDAKERVIWATNPNRPHYGECSAFSTIRFDAPAGSGDIAFTCDSASFMGSNAHAQAPEALVSGGKLDGRDGDAQEPCAAWQVSIELPPHAIFECTYLLGEAADRLSAIEIIRDLSTRHQVQQAFDAVTEFWKDLTSAIAIETPDREIDLMVNGWLLYQNLSCRMWGRSAYYQPGGAFGFRDQLQDSAAFVYHRPNITREQILQHAAQQFTEGDVLHWWHPDTGYGLRTRFSDDLLWLPYIAAEYVHKTGDQSILDEVLPFIVAAPLEDGQQEAYLRPAVCDESASLYEHCCRALDRGLTTGPNGLPLIGCGDWNDGFSRVGRLGRGESVWLGFFIDHVLERVLPLCARRGDDGRVARYSAYRQQLRSALNSAGWDGAWYRRAYYDNGQPIGSASSDECHIDALAQAWAVISGVAPPERAQMAMDAAEARLIDDDAGMIRLLTPAFDSTPNDPGYIKGYLPGIRENGGQYTHGVLWVVRAMAEMGRGTRAVELARMLSPVWHASTKQRADTYQTEPYVVAADVYGKPPHVGRGGWTWYTGSAGWMYRVAVESIFGFNTEQGRTLIVNPSISSAWPRCRLSYRLPDNKTRYEVTIENPSGNEHGVQDATFDGQPTVVEGGAARIPLHGDGKVHHIILRL